MPFVEETDDEKRRREEAEGGGVPVAGTTGGTMPGNSGTRSPGAAPNNAFVDVAAYLNANRPQAQDTANRVAGKLGEEEHGIRSGIQTAGQQYSKDVGAGTVMGDQDMVGRAASDPTNFVKNQDDLSKFLKQRDAAYTGPGSFEETPEFNDVLQRARTGQANAKGIDTSAGRKTYLHSIGANPTEGDVSLDDLLIGADPNARRTLSNAAAPFDTLTGALSDAQKSASDTLTQGRGTTDATRAAVANKFTGASGAIPTFNSDLAKRLSDARTLAQKNADATMQTIKAGGNLMPEEAKQIGLDGWGDIQNLRKLLASPTPFGDTAEKYDRNIDLSPYFTQQNPEVAITKENAATSQDYAREAALQQLMGDQYDTLPTDASKAGTAPNTFLHTQGDPRGDLQNLLNEIDTSFLNQYKDFNLGAGSEDDWLSRLQDPKEAAAYKGMVDIYGRNESKLNPLQQGVEKQLADWIQRTQGDAFKPPTDQTGSARLRVIQDSNGQGRQMWWDGGKWIAAPPEFRGMQNGQYTERFNFDTGQYEPYSGGGGVFHAL